MSESGILVAGARYQTKRELYDRARELLRVIGVGSVPPEHEPFFATIARWHPKASALVGEGVVGFRVAAWSRADGSGTQLRLIAIRPDGSETSVSVQDAIQRRKLRTVYRPSEEGERWRPLELPPAGMIWTPEARERKRQEALGRRRAGQARFVSGSEAASERTGKVVVRCGVCGSPEFADKLERHHLEAHAKAA